MLTISPLFVAVCAAMFTAMSFQIAIYRKTNGVDLGHDGDPYLRQLVRAQGNAAEYMPMGLILLVVLDLMNTPTILLSLFGLVFLAGRVLHAAALFRKRQNYRFRFVGMVLTFCALIAMTFTAVVMTFV